MKRLITVNGHPRGKKLCLASRDFRKEVCRLSAVSINNSDGLSLLDIQSSILSSTVALLSGIVASSFHEFCFSSCPFPVVIIYHKKASFCNASSGYIVIIQCRAAIQDVLLPIADLVTNGRICYNRKSNNEKRSGGSMVTASPLLLYEIHII